MIFSEFYKGLILRFSFPKKKSKLFNIELTINVFFRKNRKEGDRLFINSHTFLCKDYPRNRKVAFPYHLQANISIIKGRI